MAGLLKYLSAFSIIIWCRDAAALAQFWAWLEGEVHKKVALTEVEVADKLLEFRSNQPGFVDTSFDTISGTSTSCGFLLLATCNIVQA